MPRQDIDRLISDLKRDEGWRASAYKDHLGFLTIGYGFLIDERRGGELPPRIAEAWLKHAAEIRWAQLTRLHPWLRDQPEDVQCALGNMAYQLGVAGVGKFKNMLAALEAGDRQHAAREALESTWAHQTPERAKRVAILIRGGT